MEALLSESVDEATERESSRFAEIGGGTDRPLVLHGCGGLGRRTLTGLQALGYDVLAFSDNSAERWNTTVDGVTVMSTRDAAQQFGETAVFVVSVWRSEGGFRTSDLVEELRGLGCRRVARIGELYWAHPDRFLPYYGLDLPSHALTQKDSIRRAFSLFDASSRQEYVAQLRWRLHLDAAGIGDDSAFPIYFPPDLIALRDDEVLVDAGGYDGDTVRSFIDVSGGRFGKVISFEPDPANLARLHNYVESLDPELARRIEVSGLALGRHDGQVTFAAEGTAAARVSSSSGTTVEMRRLTEVPGAYATTFYKLDVEGGEPGALAGADPILVANRPILAVSAYHEQGHLWQLPLQLHAVLPSEYEWHLRAYSQEGFDVVLYGVPAERAVKR